MPALRWLNAALLVLAACRALVPGLCATQLAMQESSDLRAAAHALPACCAAEAPCAPRQSDALPSWLPAAPPHAACGLCALMQGMLDPLAPFVLDTPPTVATGVLPRETHPALHPMPRTRHGRAPPVLLMVS